MKKAIFIILFILQTLEIYAQSPRFSFTSDAVTLEITEKLKIPTFKVYKGSYSSIDQVYGKNAMLGDFIQTDTSVQFRPLLPFQKDNTYTVSYKNQTYPFTIALDSDYTHLQIETLYPNTGTLPSNFLKWYIRFSKPVNPSKIYEHITLINNQTNTNVDRALLPLETPLLSDDGTLLTLWIEPGRQKRDLGPNRRLGEVLLEGASYTLIIDKELKDHQGIPMNKDFKHSFTVEAADRIKPSITSWELKLPTVNTKETLSISFKELLDYGSLKNSIMIIDELGSAIEGDFIISNDQKSITFTPLTIWIKNTYTIKYKSIIEDVSGNNLERLFDRDITTKKELQKLQYTFTIQ